jgi:integrase
MVMNKNNQWIIKDVPKTEDSDRIVKVPGYLLELIGEGTGRIVPVYPNTICKRFIKLRDKLGLSIKFHDLRHYFASTAAVLNIPDIYTADMGGWSRAGNAPVMKSVYQNNIKSMSDYYADKMADHMQKVFTS